uniref:Uncharacterized protein n=1 Tax=Faxonius propinquus nudivirus TaxID=3139431 RepID=A0AAU8GBP2_9VIRU
MVDLKKNALNNLKKYIKDNNDIDYRILDKYCEILYKRYPEYNPPHYIPRPGFWDENAQILIGDSIPLHVDPKNYYFYYYQNRKLMSE